MKVYILKSLKVRRYYVGVTSDTEERLIRHNQGRNSSTKPYRPWKVIYIEEFKFKSEALKRERQIKSYKGGEAFKKLIKNAGIV